MTKRRRQIDDQLGLEGSGLDLLKEAEVLRRPTEIRTVDPRKIAPAASQPRQEFDTVRLESLAESIRQHGVLQPLLVRERGDGGLELLAGERRQRAAILAGIDRVPVRVVTADDMAAAAITLTENLAREDLSPWEEASGIAALRGLLGAAGASPTRDELARSVGRSNGSVSESLLIADRIGALLPIDGIEADILVRLPKTALHGAAQAHDPRARLELLKLAVRKVLGSEAAGKAVAAAKAKRGRPPKAWTVADRLRDRGTLSFTLRRKPQDLAPQEARDALSRLEPVVAALRARAEKQG
jgi:ParB family transcriptional regulator, chromosome partitioning protein